MSATAPSVLPPPDITREMAQAMTTSTTEPAPLTSTISTTTSVSSLGGLLSMDFSSRGGGTSGMIEGGGSSRSGGAGTSTGTRNYGKEVEFPVVDMADVMFNTGVSSGINSMDFIFHSGEDKWDSSEDKKDTGK